MKNLVFLFSVAILTGCASAQWQQIEAGRRFLYQRDNPIAARRNFQPAIEIAQKENDQYALAVAYQEMGFTYVDGEHDFEKAREYYNKSKEISEKNGYHYLLAENFYNLANICNKKKDFSKSCIKSSCEDLKRSQEKIDIVKTLPPKPPQGNDPNTIASLQKVVTMLGQGYHCK